jgi:predicted ATP-grasp superfamily ATP-dependent carboligase
LGAGSQATFLVRDFDELSACELQASAEGWQGESIWQPFLPGLAASAAILVGSNEIAALLPAVQHLSDEGRFHYLGGTMPLAANLAERAIDLARRSVAALDGLCGYVGVDMVLGIAKDGSADWLIEINPRMTTSYVGLRYLAEENLAGAILQAATGERIQSMTWRQQGIRFFPDGKVAAVNEESLFGL